MKIHKTYYGCTSITEVKDDQNVVGYNVIHDGESVYIPDCNVLKKHEGGKLAVSTGRKAISQIQKTGSTITSIHQERFCEDEDNKCYDVWTTAEAP